MTLQEFFKMHPKVAIAFSGGVDSAYLLYAARKYAAEAVAYYVKAAFQPAFETADALRLAEDLGMELRILPLDVLSVPEVTANPKNRCYYCKQQVFGAILKAAASDGFAEVLDGTNASDDAGDRPGMKALQELHVLSPLRECGLTKTRIRELSREAGLFTWDKPSYACLATRVPAGTPITADILKKTEDGESFLFSLGLKDFRIRYLDGHARLQVPEAQLPLVLSHRREILASLKPAYQSVLLDLETRGED